MVGLAAAGQGWLRYALRAASASIAGIGGAFVGVFPMDYLGAHSLAALTFFILGLVDRPAGLDRLRPPTGSALPALAGGRRRG